MPSRRIWSSLKHPRSYFVKSYVKLIAIVVPREAHLVGNVHRVESFTTNLLNARPNAISRQDHDT